MPRDSSRDHTERFTYLITFSCYGCRLHDDESRSVDLGHNAVESPLVEADPMRVAAEQGLMDQAPYCMERRHREVVLASLRERCSERQWTLLAAHVRTSHLHIVVKADARPERVMNDLKSYASRCLNRAGLDQPTRKRWARHGSTRWLGKRENVSTAIRYVVDKQGDPMAVFEASERGR